MFRIVGGISISAALLYSALIAGPSIEAAVNPVYDSIVPVNIETKPTTETFRFLVNKRRDCQVVSRGWYFGDPADVFQRVKFTPLDEQLGEVTLPTGLQYTDRFEVDLSQAGAFRKQFGVVVHRCHGLWNQTTIIGPYPLPFPPEG